MCRSTSVTWKSYTDRQLQDNRIVHFAERKETMSHADRSSSTQKSTAEKLRAAGVNTDSDEEREIWSGTFSNKAILGHALVVGLISLLLLIVVAAVGVLRSNFYVWMGALVLIAIHWLVVGGILVYNKLSRHYELTTQRFKHRAGILTRTSDRIELIDIDDVRVRQGPVQALVGVGNIVITSSDATHPELILPGIEDVRSVADLIDDARRAERRKRGLHIEAI